ncbi:30S ribosomal protein S1 [Cutibacterium granulosum]|uniref:30S ribosomal protein S1 n=1 Tax=Cutibacterium granulosum TaxID=33011 RepID=UPI002B232C8F|nr:30S ribosomal protein S1 [Cutibacterium granulosum]MEA5656009.1 30S ribosomal protein S1 [Cutibacterium granulosum]
MTSSTEASTSNSVDNDQQTAATATENNSVTVDDLGSTEAFMAAVDATIKYFNDGDIVTGTVVKVDRDEVLLDIGYKTEGVIPSKELSIKHDVDPFDVVKVGDEIEALVQQKEDKEGRLILSKKRAQYERAWGSIEKIKDEEGVVSGTVIEVVKGGLIVDIGLRGFLPASLVEMRRVRDLQPYVGEEIEAKIIELDKNRNNVVLSRRAWLEQTQSEVRHNFLQQLQKGQIRKGVVSSIVNFGAFVDLGGVDGLVHVSELSWKHIDHPGEVVEVGQPVTVEVLDVDMDRERVSLSLKATQEDPWQAFARLHQIGQIVPGKVTKLVPFGAFVRVEDGIEGLVHVSELAERHVEIPEQVVSVNDDVMVKIIDIDLDRRRISLSLKQANEGMDTTSDEFDPSLYGMTASYDETGNYIYPEGFDPETNEWKPGYDEQRIAWEQQYAEAQARWEAHKKQVIAAEEAEREAAVEQPASATSYTSQAPTEGSLASDEALQALRDKLTNG